MKELIILLGMLNPESAHFKQDDIKRLHVTLNNEEMKKIPELMKKQETSKAMKVHLESMNYDAKEQKTTIVFNSKMH